MALDAAGGLLHEPDDADDKDGGDEFDPAFDDVAVESGAGDDDCDRDGGGDGGTEGPEESFLEFVSTDFGEVSEDDADDQGCFDALAERNDKCLQHKDNSRSQGFFRWSGFARITSLRGGRSHSVAVASLMRTKLVVN